MGRRGSNDSVPYSLASASTHSGYVPSLLLFVCDAVVVLTLNTTRSSNHMCLFYNVLLQWGWNWLGGGGGLYIPLS